MNKFTILFRDKEISYDYATLKQFEYFDNLLNSGMIESKTKRTTLDCCANIFEYVCRNITFNDMFTTNGEGERIAMLKQLLDLADYMQDKRIKDMFLQIFNSDSITYNSKGAMIADNLGFFIDEDNFLSCSILRSNMQNVWRLNPYDLSESHMVSICKITQHAELLQVVRLINKCSKVNDNIWKEMSKYRYTVDNNTFAHIALTNRQLLTLEVVVNHLAIIDFGLYDEKRGAEVFDLRCPSFPSSHRNEDLTVDVNSKELVITASNNLYRVAIRIQRGPVQYLFIGQLKKGEKFMYLNVMPGVYYQIHYALNL